MSNKKHSDPFLKAFGNRIQILRKAAGYSQESFALKVGLHRTYMSSIERGEHNVSLLNIIKIAKTLSLSVEKLMESIK